MKKIRATLFLFVLAYPFILYGQNREAGLRSGYRGGIFYQVTGEYGNTESGYNALLSFDRGLQITGLRVIYENALSGISPDLYFAWGYGGHAGFMYTNRFNYLQERIAFTRERFCPVIGGDGWLSAEYRFREIPVNISLNVKPFAELILPVFVRIIPWDIGLSISYVF